MDLLSTSARRHHSSPAEPSLEVRPFGFCCGEEARMFEYPPAPVSQAQFTGCVEQRTLSSSFRMVIQ